MDGLTDHQQIADNFEKDFVALGSVVQSNASCNMQYIYEHTRPNYVGSSYLEEYRFDAELVGTVIKNLKRGKAAGLDTLTACLLYTSPSPRDGLLSRMPSSA